MIAQQTYDVLAQYVGYAVLIAYPVFLVLLYLAVRRERRRLRTGGRA